MVAPTVFAEGLGEQFTLAPRVPRIRQHVMILDVTPPVYLPMLAASGAGKLQGEWAAEPKLDGWRTIVTVDPSLPSGIEVRSRTGRFLTTQVPELHDSPTSVSVWCSTASLSR